MQHYRTVCAVRILPELAKGSKKKKEQKKKNNCSSLCRALRTLMTSFGFLCQVLGVQVRASVRTSAPVRKRRLTFDRVNHLRIHRRGDDRQGEFLQVPAHTIAQNWELQLLQVCRWSIWSATQYNWVNSVTCELIKR